MDGIRVAHSNQYHLGACSSCLGAGAGVIEAVVVCMGTHLCADCHSRFITALGQAGASRQTAFLTTIATHPHSR